MPGTKFDCYKNTHDGFVFRIFQVKLESTIVSDQSVSTKKARRAVLERADDAQAVLRPQQWRQANMVDEGSSVLLSSLLARNLVWHDW